MTFQELKIVVIQATQLDKDALHIYVGLSVYLVSFVLSKAMLTKYWLRQLLAIIMVTCAAFLGEYFDLQGDLTIISTAKRVASIHDIINTCAIPYFLAIVMTWTSLFQRQ